MTMMEMTRKSGRRAGTSTACRRARSPRCATVDRIDGQVVVDEPIQDQLEDAAPDPLDADLIDLVPLVVVVVAAELLEVDDRKQREADVRQQEEVRRASATAAAASASWLPVVEVD